MVALASLNTLGTIGFSFGLATFVTTVFEGEKAPDEMLWLALVCGLLKASLLWAQENLSARAAIATKTQLRKSYLAAIDRLGSAWLIEQESAKLTSIATTGLDALDNYFSRYLPQLAYTAIITPVLAAVIFAVDPVSGFTLLLTIPLIPIFMSFIGLVTRSAQSEQLQALHTLSQHLLEVLRGLTTLRVFGRASAQVGIVGSMATELRKRTMKVLRVSFLSGFTLELIGSLAVALIAVSIGLRLVNGELDFSTGLFVLLLAPEAFLPIRMVGANFHAAADGIAVSKEILDTIDLPKPSRYNGEIQIRASQINLVTGPSGAGKTTLLTAKLESLGYDQCAWMPQRNVLLADTVQTNIVGPNQPVDLQLLEKACQFSALDDLRLETMVGENSEAISGGQSQRIALARTFYRALTVPSVNHLLLDEPLSSLDSKRAKIVIDSMKTFADAGKTLLVISHQQFDAGNVIKLAGTKP
ncbi:MAG: ABC transporter ATP-binding protein/permease [Micrococcales bacterium]